MGEQGFVLGGTRPSLPVNIRPDNDLPVIDVAMIKGGLMVDFWPKLKCSRKWVMKILVVVAAVIVIAGIGLGDSILGILGAVAVACVGTDALARRYEPRQRAQA